jgi:enoyl-[acyl-carrier protein] reductase II
VKVTNSERVMPPFNRPGGPAEPRALSTPLIDQLRAHPEWVDAAAMGARLRESLLAGAGHEYLPFTGQSAGLIEDVLPAAEIVARVVAEAEAVLSRARGAP